MERVVATNGATRGQRRVNPQDHALVGINLRLAQWASRAGAENLVHPRKLTASGLTRKKNVRRTGFAGLRECALIRQSAVRIVTRCLGLAIYQMFALNKNVHKAGVLPFHQTENLCV